MPDGEVYSIKEMIGEFRNDVNNRFNNIDAAYSGTSRAIDKLKLRSAFLSGGLCVVMIIVIPLIGYIWNQSQENRTKLEVLSNNGSQYYGANNTITK